MSNFNNSKRIAYISSLLLFSSIMTHSVDAEGRKDVRFYKVNKQQQASRLFFTRKKGKQAGCHNFLKKARVHRVNQFGYQFCSLYTKKDCPENNIVNVTREKDSTPTTKLTQGFSWFPESEHVRGKKLASWSCHD